jgi:hypothetical protein
MAITDEENYLTRARGKKTKNPIKSKTGARLMEP